MTSLRHSQCHMVKKWTYCDIYRGIGVTSLSGSDASFVLQVPADLGSNEILPLFSTPLDDRSYMVAVYETNCGLQQVQQGYQTSIFVVDADAMEI